MQDTKENDRKNISAEKLIALSEEFDNYDIVEHLEETKPAKFDIQLTR